MTFSTQEFPGRVFDSLEELETAKKEQKQLRRELGGGTTVIAEKIEDSVGDQPPGD